MNNKYFLEEYQSYQKEQGGLVVSLQHNDEQCGKIYFNKNTRVLKYVCTFCGRAFDDINYYCTHLSEHLPQNSDDDDYEVDMEGEEEEEETNEDDDDAAMNNFCDVTEFNELKNYLEANNDASEIEEEVQQELRDFFNEDNSSNNSDAEHFHEDKPNDFSIYETAAKVSDYEESINTRPLEKNNPLPKRKVTTIKVIAVKNRVEEIYAQIKATELRGIKEDDATNVDANKTEKQATDVATTTTTQLTQGGVRKIVGETVITLLPENKIKQIATNALVDIKDTLTCPACGLKFRNSFGLTIHKRTHYLESNNAVKLAHKCFECPKLFNRLSELKVHVQLVHYPEGFICRLCERKFSSLTLLETHMVKAHLMKYNCEMCKKSFSIREQFENHVNTHLNNKIDWIKCTTCGRRFSNQYSLQQHMRRHKERNPQCCVVCGKLTMRITQHMKIHTPRPKRLLACHICGKTFNFSSGLSYHMKYKHNRHSKSESATICDEKQQQQDVEVQSKEYYEENKIKVEQAEAEEFVDETTKKEEEARRVIVEIIQNATYKSFFPEADVNILDLGPPVGREETITAVNSIAHHS